MTSKSPDASRLDAEARLLLHALSRTLAHVDPSPGNSGIITVQRRRPTGDKAIGDFPQALWNKFVALGFVSHDENDNKWRISSTGKAAANMVLRPPGKERIGRIRTSEKVAPQSSRVKRAAQRNDDESPLAWLARRKGRDGQAMLSQAQFAAGERLREDFWHANLNPRVTMDWSAAMSGGSARKRSLPGVGVNLCDAVLAARTRVNQALCEVGPELSGILIDVCCHLKGLESSERNSGWPQRSGKVVLLLALSSLARHYGLETDTATRDRGAMQIRHWGRANYRPQIGPDI